MTGITWCTNLCSEAVRFCQLHTLSPKFQSFHNTKFQKLPTPLDKPTSACLPLSIAHERLPLWLFRFINRNVPQKHPSKEEIFLFGQYYWISTFYEKHQGLQTTWIHVQRRQDNSYWQASWCPNVQWRIPAIHSHSIPIPIQQNQGHCWPCITWRYVD